MEGRRFCLAVMSVVLIGSLHHVAGQGRGVPGSMAFFSARDGNNEIYVMDWDGRRPLRMTDDPASDVDPDISPNGRDIVFTSNRSGNNDIYIVDRDRRNPVNLTNISANDGWARWAPDGEHIVFHTNRDGNFELYVMNRDGDGLMRLTNYPGIDQFPDWSPNGQEIAFRRDIDVYVLDVRERASPPADRRAAAQPDAVVVTQRQAAGVHEHACRIYLRVRDERRWQRSEEPDAEGPRRPRTATGSAGRPRGRRTGRQIYFMSSRPSTGLDTEIFIMNTDGTGITRLTNSIGMDGSPRAR